MLIFATAVAALGALLLFVGATMLEGEVGRRQEPMPAGRAARGEKSSRGTGLRTAVPRPAFWLIAAAFAMMALNHGLLINHIVPILVDRDLSEATAAPQCADAQKTGRHWPGRRGRGKQ